MVKVAYTTDAHGKVIIYEKLLSEAAADRKVGAVLIGGDITPLDGPFSLLMSRQRKFLKDWFVPRLARFRDEVGKPVFVIMGNDDFSINMDLLANADKKGLVHSVHGRAVNFGDYSIIGYSFINESPFIMKDWDRDENVIGTELMRLFGKAGRKKTIILAHAPPFGTRLDVLYTGSHIGSSGVRAFIEECQPFLYLCGHIHESPDMSGATHDRVRKTICINPGNHAVSIIDLDDPLKMKRIKLL